MNAEIIQRLQDTYSQETLTEMSQAAADIERAWLEERLHKALMSRLMFELGGNLSADAMQSIIDKIKLPENE